MRIHMEFSSFLVWSWILIKRTEEFQAWGFFLICKEIMLTSVCFAKPYFVICTNFDNCQKPKSKGH